MRRHRGRRGRSRSPRRLAAGVPPADKYSTAFGLSPRRPEWNASTAVGLGGRDPTLRDMLPDVPGKWMESILSPRFRSNSPRKKRIGEHQGQGSNRKRKRKGRRKKKRRRKRRPHDADMGPSASVFDERGDVFERAGLPRALALARRNASDAPSEKEHLIRVHGSVLA